jgi:hypothetical protein
VLREGANGAVKVGPVFHAVNKNPTIAAADMTIADALILLKNEKYALVENSGARQVVDLDSIGRWATYHAGDGIVDLTEWALSDALAQVSATPVISRSALVADLLVVLGFKSKTPSRYCIVTENGKTTEKTLGVADIYDFIG